jgi:hypothetical protein
MVERYLYKRKWEAWKRTHAQVCPHCKRDISGVAFNTEVLRGHHTGGRCTVPDQSPIIIAS